MKPVLIMKFPFSSRFGGGENHTLQLADAFQRHGAKVFFAGSCRVLLQEFRRRHWPARRLHVAKEPVTPWAIPVFLLLWPLTVTILFWTLAWYRLRHGVRTLYCLSLPDQLVATPIARFFGMRVVWGLHVAAGRWMKWNPYRPFFVLSSLFARVVVISESLVESYRSVGIPRSRLRVIYPGIDVAPYMKFRRQTFHWTKRFVVGTVARLDAEKGIPVLLRAFQEFSQLVPQARLVLVGDGPERQQLVWLAKQLEINDRTQWPGFQRNVPGWMSSFDAFVLPSVKRESFGIVLLEALAAGCPVVASDLGGIPEVIDNNRTGVLVEPGDHELLAQALLFLYRHPDIAMQLGQQGRRRVAERFTLETMVRSFETLFS